MTMSTPVRELKCDHWVSHAAPSPEAVVSRFFRDMDLYESSSLALEELRGFHRDRDVTDASVMSARPVVNFCHVVMEKIGSP